LAELFFDTLIYCDQYAVMQGM